MSDLPAPTSPTAARRAAEPQQRTGPTLTLTLFTLFTISTLLYAKRSRASASRLRAERNALQRELALQRTREGLASHQARAPVSSHSEVAQEQEPRVWASHEEQLGTIVEQSAPASTTVAPSLPPTPRAPEILRAKANAFRHIMKDNLVRLPPAPPSVSSRLPTVNAGTSRLPKWKRQMPTNKASGANLMPDPYAALDSGYAQLCKVANAVQWDSTADARSELRKASAATNGSSGDGSGGATAGGASATVATKKTTTATVSMLLPITRFREASFKQQGSELRGQRRPAGPAEPTSNSASAAATSSEPVVLYPHKIPERISQRVKAAGPAVPAPAPIPTSATPASAPSRLAVGTSFSEASELELLASALFSSGESKQGGFSEGEPGILDGAENVDVQTTIRKRVTPNLKEAKQSKKDPWISPSQASAPQGFWPPTALLQSRKGKQIVGVAEEPQDDEALTLKVKRKPESFAKGWASVLSYAPDPNSAVFPGPAPPAPAPAPAPTGSTDTAKLQSRPRPASSASWPPERDLAILEHAEFYTPPAAHGFAEGEELRACAFPWQARAIAKASGLAARTPTKVSSATPGTPSSSAAASSAPAVAAVVPASDDDMSVTAAELALVLHDRGEVPLGSEPVKADIAASKPVSVESNKGPGASSGTSSSGSAGAEPSVKLSSTTGSSATSAASASTTFAPAANTDNASSTPATSPGATRKPQQQSADDISSTADAFGFGFGVLGSPFDSMHQQHATIVNELFADLRNRRQRLLSGTPLRRVQDVGAESHSSRKHGSGSSASNASSKAQDGSTSFSSASATASATESRTSAVSARLGLKYNLLRSMLQHRHDAIVAPHLLFRDALSASSSRENSIGSRTGGAGVKAASNCQQGGRSAETQQQWEWDDVFQQWRSTKRFGRRSAWWRE